MKREWRENEERMKRELNRVWKENEERMRREWRVNEESMEGE
jgi:hypothetical protein